MARLSLGKSENRKPDCSRIGTGRPARKGRERYGSRLHHVAYRDSMGLGDPIATPSDVLPWASSIIAQWVRTTYLFLRPTYLPPSLSNLP